MIELSHKPLIRAFCCDCMTFMAGVGDKAYELAIVDPPYFKECGYQFFAGSEFSSIGVQRTALKNKIKQWDIPSQAYFDELIRINKNQIIWGINYFNISFLGPGRIVWDKKNDATTFSDCEIAYCSLHKGTKIFRYRWNGMIQENMICKEIRIHPTQKPVALYRFLLTNYAKPGQTILDTHGGSFSSAIACWHEGYDMDIIELDTEYFEAACERFERETRQQKLFTERA